MASCSEPATADLNSIDKITPLIEIIPKRILPTENDPSVEVAGWDNNAEVKRSVNKWRRGREELIYNVNDNPPLHLCVFLGLQQILMALAGALTMSYTLAELICAGPTDTIRSTIFCTTLFMCGFCTILQTSIGIRLPILQGASSSFLLPLLALRNFDTWKCDGTKVFGFNSSMSDNNTSEVSTDPDNTGHMFGRLRELQGSLMLCSVLQVLVGCTGMIGVLLRFIGPLTVAPTISLIGLSLFKVTLIYAPKQWGITVMTTVLVLVFSLFLSEHAIPIPSYNWKTGCTFSRFPIFKIFPVILSVVIGWLTCYIFTLTDVFPPDKDDANYMARTDVRERILTMAPWVYVPYPGQYGPPSFSAAAFLGMIAATMASTIESIGDYYACAKVCNVPPPPKHAMNRGIAVEGLGSVISGAFGAGHGTTSYSGNVGAIGVTKVASRKVFIVAGILTMLFSVVGKVGAILVTIPHPVLGGVQIIIFGILASIGLSALQFIDLKSSRNLTVLGVSLFSGLLLPEWVSRTPKAISTGNSEVDQVITVFLGTPMLIGGVLALILDNITPGTVEERGILAWQTTHEADSANQPGLNDNIYDFPPFISSRLKKMRLASYLPFLPTYGCQLDAHLQDPEGGDVQDT